MTTMLMMMMMRDVCCSYIHCHWGHRLATFSYFIHPFILTNESTEGRLTKKQWLSMHSQPTHGECVCVCANFNRVLQILNRCSACHKYFQVKSPFTKNRHQNGKEKKMHPSVFVLVRMVNRGGISLDGTLNIFICIHPISVVPCTTIVVAYDVNYTT